MKNSGIYIITNKENEFIYLGSSKNLKKRKYIHFWMLDSNIHFNKKLQNAYNKYGKKSFNFEVICNCPSEYLMKLEQWFIDNLKPNYNVAKKALNIEKIYKRKNSELINVRNRKKVHQYSLMGKFIKTWNSCSEAARSFNCSASQIIEVCNGNRKTSQNYYWTYEKDKINFKRIIKKVIGVHKITNEEVVFDNVEDAAKFVNGTKTNICAVMYGREKTYKKYKWSYEQIEN